MCERTTATVRVAAVCVLALAMPHPGLAQLTNVHLYGWFDQEVEVSTQAGPAEE
jgi:hypothetical protein